MRLFFYGGTKGEMKNKGEICELLTKRRAGVLCIVWKGGGANRKVEVIC